MNEQINGYIAWCEILERHRINKRTLGRWLDQADFDAWSKWVRGVWYMKK